MIAIGGDHASPELKRAVIDHLTAQGYEVKDYGCHSAESVDYPDYALKVAHAVADGACEMGILICGTGIGMAIAANKMPGIRAANVTSVQFAHLAREHNDANVVTLSGRFVPLENNEAIVDEFLSTPFGEGRHARRVGKIMALEG